MRSTEDLHGSRGVRQAQARRVGAYLTAVATAAGYDVRRRQGGRAQLAAMTGLSLTTISRTLDGKTLPLPAQLATWAAVLNLDHGRMLLESGIIPAQRGPRDVEHGERRAASPAREPHVQGPHVPDAQVQDPQVQACHVHDGPCIDPFSPAVFSAPASLSPDEAMNAWGITDPVLRRTLTGSIVQAVQLQRELDAALAGGLWHEGE
ncbi:transcriptional regulator [Streptomyces sp. LaPpAH-108]|uniref:transcriptional regulator n=1 Tax=Streptomyces sp. LaPpAH-108 TaxID=1155714 RepID=UPI001319E254|nr:transcriptional regulator [Streptomyces sp. LaPpAH-108]